MNTAPPPHAVVLDRQTHNIQVSKKRFHTNNQQGINSIQIVDAKYLMERVNDIALWKI